MIRAMTSRDVPDVVAIAAASLPEAWDEVGFTSELGKTTCLALTMLDETRVIAFAIGSVVLDELEVLTIAVAPDARRAGVGRALLRALLRTSSASTAHLEVRANNTSALALYAACGFTITGRRVRYYSDGEDALLMAWSSRAT